MNADVRLRDDDHSSAKWSIATQRAGNWIEVKDASSTRWSIAQIVSLGPTEIRVNVATWRKHGRDEFLARATCRARVAKLGTHVSLILSPSYPLTRKQGSVWTVGLQHVQRARDDFDAFFYDPDATAYVAQRLVPFVEKSLLCQFVSIEMADAMNKFHQHVLKNVVAKLLSVIDTSESSASTTTNLLALLRLLLNAHSACLFFYAKYSGVYDPTKYDKLVFTTYVTDALTSLPTRHPCRSFYFVDNVDLFIQAGGLRVVLQRIALVDVALEDIALFGALLQQAKPCIVQHKRRRRSASASATSLQSQTSKRRTAATSIDGHIEAFFRTFLASVLARLQHLTNDELKDDDGLVDHIVSLLDRLYRDGVLLQSTNDVGETDDTDETLSNDVLFAQTIELFHLELSKRLICCPFLAQRLLGIARLIDLIAMAQRRDDAHKRSGLRRIVASTAVATSSSSSSALLTTDASVATTASSTHAPTAQWLRVSIVIDWLATSDVLEVMLGDKDRCAAYGLPQSTHLEVLKRAKALCVFAAAHNVLHETHVVLLWQAAMRQLRSGRKTVLDLLLVLCTVVAADVVDVVMVLLTQVPLRAYDDVILHFVQRLVLVAAKRVVEIETMTAAAAAGGVKKTLSALVGVSTPAASNKLSVNAQRDVDVLNKVVTLGCCLLWNGLLDARNDNDDDDNPTALPAAMQLEVETALAATLNAVHLLWTTATSTTSAKEQQLLLSAYVRKCVDNLERSELVETSMRLLQRIVDGFGAAAAVDPNGVTTATGSLSTLGLSLPRAASFSSSSSSSRAAAASLASPSDFLKTLNATYDLVRVVTTEIQRYMAAATVKRPDNATHKRAMSQRLAFLSFIITKSDVELSFEDVVQLSQCFASAANPSTFKDEGDESDADDADDDREVFFAWLADMVPDHPSTGALAYRTLVRPRAFAINVLSELFAAFIASTTTLSPTAKSSNPNANNNGDETIFGLDVETMGPHAFRAFERLFRLVNTSERALSSVNSVATANGYRSRASSAASALSTALIINNDGDAPFVVESLHLKGLETLYEIALCASHDIVSRDARNYLIALHLHVGPKLVRREAWSDFCTGVFQRIDATTRAAGIHDDDARALLLYRLLELLGTFLYQSVDHPSPVDNSTGLEALVVHVRTQDGRTATAPLQYDVRRSSLVSELRDRIARDTTHPADRVRLVTHVRTKLTAQGHDKWTLEKARVFGSSNVSSSKLSAALTATATPSASERQRTSSSSIEAILLTKVESDTIGHVVAAAATTTRDVAGAFSYRSSDSAVRNRSHTLDAIATGSRPIDVASDWRAVYADIARNSRSVALLFALLAQRTDVCEAAWNVLKLLPPDVAIVSQMQTLNDTLAVDGSIRTFPAVTFNWQPLLDRTCPPKLLYQLELVERFAIARPSGSGVDDKRFTDAVNTNGSEAPPPPAATAAVDSSSNDRLLGTPNNWSASFLKLGGKLHLLPFVFAISSSSDQSALTLVCLAKVLKLLRHFVLVESTLAAERKRDLESDTDEEDDDTRSSSAGRANAIDATDETQALLHHLLALLEQLHATPCSSAGDATTDSASASSTGVRAFQRPTLEDADNVWRLPRGAYVMTRVLSFIATSALAAPRDALALLESYASHQTILLDCLVASAYRPVRQQAAHLIAALSTTQNPNQRDRSACCRYFLDLLSAFDGNVRHDEFYSVYTLLVTHVDSLDGVDVVGASRLLCRRVQRFVVCDDDDVNSESTPSTDAHASSDALLEALLATLVALVRRIPPTARAGRLEVPFTGRLLRDVVATTLHVDENIVDEVFHRCLFATPETSTTTTTTTATQQQQQQEDDNDAFSSSSTATLQAPPPPSAQYYLQQPTCRSASARDTAFALLTALVQASPTVRRYVLEQVAQQHSLDTIALPSAVATAVDAASSSSSAPLTASRRKSSSKVGTTATTAAASTTRTATLVRAKYVGLKNLGCTCYLNSTLQAFFMIPRFRRQILRFSVAAAAPTASTSAPATDDATSVLFELQSLFAHLEGTAKAYYNPRAFTLALKTWDNERIDVNQQQDASEFLTSFFQQLESDMKRHDPDKGGDTDDATDDDRSCNNSSNNNSNSSNNILETFFGGVFSNELVADGDRLYSERSEPFHYISVPVRDRATLTESLDSWVEGETVSYTWDTARGSNDQNDDNSDNSQSDAAERVTLETHKRISIAKLPDQLIIHLKRFEFDFERMEPIKLHDRFAFPTELDMFPYTKAGQAAKRRRARAASSASSASSSAASTPTNASSAQRNYNRAFDASDASDLHLHGGRLTAPEYSQYELVGTVVHMGSAHSGHYYSFLREHDTPNRQWFEFNDTLVTPFDASQIPNECFGGEDDRPLAVSAAAADNGGARSSAAGGGGGGGGERGTNSAASSQMKTRSSFMLFYARKRPTLQLVRDDGLLASSTTHNIKPISLRVCARVVTFCAKLQCAAAGRIERLRRVAQVIAPARIRDVIATENRLFWRKTYLLDARCLQFTLDVVQSGLVESSKTHDVDAATTTNPQALVLQYEPADAHLLALQTAIAFVFGTTLLLPYGSGSSSDDASTALLVAWDPVLRALLQIDARGGAWLLRTLRESLLLELLVLHERAAVRDLVARVVSEAIATTMRLEAQRLTDANVADTDDSDTRNDATQQLPVAYAFIFQLVQLLPVVLTVPPANEQPLVATLLAFAVLGRNEAAFLVVNRVVGALVALLTGAGASQPLLQPQFERLERLERNESRQPRARLELSATVIKLLALLLRCSVPPAIDTTSDVLPSYVGLDAVAVPRTDCELLATDAWVALLARRPSRFSPETKPLEQLVAHLCFESQRTTTHFLDVIARGIEAADHHDVKPFVRTLGAMLRVRDSLASVRLQDGLAQLLHVMAANQQFYKATEVAIDMLTRLAKRQSRVTRWLYDHRASYQWIVNWLRHHRYSTSTSSSSSRANDDMWLLQGRTVLVKPHSTSAWAGVSLSSPGLLKTVDRTVTRLLPRMRALLADDATPTAMDPFYDSDENPMRLIGKRVRVKWAKDKWYDGRVTRFDAATYEHAVEYDDGDRRCYRMAEKQFYVVVDDDDEKEEKNSVSSSTAATEASTA